MWVATTGIEVSSMSQYIFVSEKNGLTWTEADAAARAMGGLLVSVNTAEEDAFIRGVLAEHDRLWSAENRDGARNGPWIGLFQPDGSSEPGGGWTWLDGTTPAFNGWHPNQPDNFIGDKFAFYWEWRGSIGWADQTDDPAGAGYDPVTSFAVELDDGARRLTGTLAGEIFYGGAINNVIKARGGADVIDGAGGRDLLSGGPGIDRFVFSAADEADGDTILDLEARDRIDLRAIDADEGVAEDQRFRLADAFTGRAGQLVVTSDGTSATIAGDTDGDGLADFTIGTNGDLTLVIDALML